MRLARVILVIQVLVFAGFGLAYWFRPYEMANLNGMLLMETASVSNVRVYYGGLQIGLALFLLWALCERERVRAALVLLVLMQGCLALARLGALWLDDAALPAFDFNGLAYKLASALLAAFALSRLARPPLPDLPTNGDLDDDPVPPPRRCEGRDTPAQGLPEMAPGAPGER